MRKGIKNLLRGMLLSFLIVFGIQQPYQVQAATGTIEYNDGEETYVGKYNAKTETKEGKGKYYCFDGTVITGVWKNDYLKGKATVIYPNKDKYVGYFKNDERNGSGTYTWKNGDKYKGLWKNDAMNGKGTYTWKNKNYVTGTWKNGKLNGKATLKIRKYKYSIKVSNGKLKKVYSRKKA